ncbi:MAG: UDP-N-acetylmuramoyl-tripeptide--D-alanyl-D-alanine ligase [Patescibacteria group bacterium]
MSLQHIFEKFLARSVRRAILRDKPLVIGVAGSVGKTSTKTAIGVALGADEVGSQVAMSDKNFNNDLGVPMTILGVGMPRRSPFKWSWLLLKAWLTSLGVIGLRAKTFVLELGTDRPGDLARLMGIVKPRIGVLTAIGAEHTEFFGSIEGVAREEAAILAMLPEDGTAVSNADDILVSELRHMLPHKALTYGTDEFADVKIESAEMNVDKDDPAHSGLRLVVRVGGTEKYANITGTVGRSQAFAAAAALTVVCAIKGDVDKAIARLESRFHGMPGRMRLIPGIKHTWLLDDTYNSSPLAVAAALDDLSEFPLPDGGRRIAALGDMLEMGPLEEETHLKMGRQAAEAGIDLLVLCGTLAHTVARGACAAGFPEDKIAIIPKSAEAGLFIQEKLREGDVVLVKGSQGVRMERIVKELMARPDLAEKLLVRHTADWLARK